MNKRPVFKLQYKDADTKQNFDVAVAWPSDREGFPPNLSPIYDDKADEEAQYPTMDFNKAVGLVGEKKGYLNISTRKGTTLRLEEEDF